MPAVTLPSNPYSSHAVILLASGLSTRLGTPKQLLKQQGLTLIEVMIRKVLITLPRVIIIVIPEGDLSIKRVVDRLISEISPIEVVFNELPQKGMGHSLNLGITTLNSLSTVSETIKRVLILGVDQILLDADHLGKLLEQDNQVVASRYDKTIEPYDLLQSRATQIMVEDASTKGKSDKVIGLPVIINMELLNNWLPTLTGDKGFRDQIRALSEDQLYYVFDPKLAFDIDTPDALRYARDRGWLD